VRNVWQWKQLGEVCKTGSGGTPLKAKKEYYEGGTIPWLLSGEVSQGEVRAAANFITQKGLENSSARMFPRNTVLVAMYGATAGQVGILRFEAATNQAVCGILPNIQFVPEFLFYFLLSKKDELVAQAAGNAQPNISQIKIRNTDVPLAPLPEQQRIVGILNEAFEGLATARANAEKNLQNARALIESQLQYVFTQRGEGWVEKKLGEMCERITKGSSPKWQGIAYVDKPGILFVTSENVGQYQMLLEQPKFVEDKFNVKDKKSILKPGDVLTNIVGASIGRTAVFDRDDAANINQAVCLIRCKPERLNNFFLTYLLNSPVFKQVLHDNEVDNARANLSLGFFSQLLVPIPPLSEQRNIVTALNSFRKETQRLESLCQRKLTALEALKKSLLHEAFTGQL
jgi:type I restriction enzyme S subunit